MAAKQENMVQRVCFTLNNYTEAEFAQICECRNLCKFIVVGKEVGENGTPHLQGYFNLIKRVRFTGLKKLMPRAHFEKAMGTDAQNLAYCTKQDKNAFVCGEPQNQGKRNDLTKATTMVKEKKTLREIASECPEIFTKFHRGLKELSHALSTPRDRNDPPTVIWLYGKTGVGKTRLVYDQFAEGQVYKKDNSIWWDGYHQQDCILLDDFNGKIDYEIILQLTDRYPFSPQCKGGYVEINSPFIIFTSEYPPSTYWSGTVYDQIIRRFAMVHEMTKKE